MHRSFSFIQRVVKIGYFTSGAAVDGAICTKDLLAFFVSIGHDVSLYAESFASDFSPVYSIPIEGNLLRTEQWWASKRFDLAIFYSLFGFSPAVLWAARRSGAIVVIEGDTDGAIAAVDSLHRELWTLWQARATPLAALRSFKGYLSAARATAAPDLKLVDVLEACHVLKIESDGPAENLRRILGSVGRVDLLGRIQVIPFPIRDVWVEQDVTANRRDLVVMAGRLSCIQKNPAAVHDTARRLVRDIPNCDLEIHVRGALSGPLTGLAEIPHIQVFTNSPRELLADRLSKAKIFASVSMWETTSIQALEAMAVGCTLVGPAWIPSFASLVDGGRFGCLFSRSSHCVHALGEELHNWHSGVRSPRLIASEWRTRCAISSVAAELLRCVESVRCDRSGPSINFS